MLHFKRALKAILFVVIFLVLSAMMGMAMKFKETKSEAMLERYSQAQDIDTIILGNSVAEMVQPDLLDELCGYHSFNMTTPDQSYSVGIREMKMVASQQPLKRVVLYTTFDAGPNANSETIDRIFDRTIDAAGPMSRRLPRKIQKNLKKSLDSDVITTEESINLWIPWTSEAADSLETAWGNFKYRVKRLAKGERLSGKVVRDLNDCTNPVKEPLLTEEENTGLQEDIEAMHALPIPDGMMTDAELTELATMCAFCSDNDIDFAVLISPHRTDYYERYSGYRDYTVIMDEFLNEFITSRGFEYYNFEQNGDLHKFLPDDYFYDFEHVQDEYADRATELIAEKLLELFR